MKIVKCVFIFLTCTAMALPSFAQDQYVNNDESNAIVENVEEIPIDSVTREEKPIEEDAAENENHLIVACLGLSGLTLITSLILLFITIKKRSKMESENNNPVEAHSDKETELQFIKVQIQQIQKLLLKQLELLNQFAAQLNNLQIVMDSSAKQEDTAMTTTHGKVEQPDQQVSTQNYQISLEQSQQLEETFVALASIVDDKVVLKVVDNQYAEQAPFEIKVKGEEGIYNFNQAATKSMLKYADTKITPFCNISIDSANIPTCIDTTSSGTIIRRGDDWIVVQKAHIHIS